MAFLHKWLTAFALPICLLAAAAPAGAQARFDLEGPKIDIRVTRAGITLPIAAVPNLQPMDQLWLHPDFPPTQSVHYLLIVAFLRGTTNPPPANWFTRIETWQKNVREEGVFVAVPAEAQQAILFLAPETSGDFSTLRSAVTGSPGIFVRAAQDLNEAGFEQARIEKYLSEIKRVPPGDASALQQHSDLLARTLALKPNPDCFKRSPDQQFTCLTQTGNQTLLDDGHGQTLVAALSSGPSSDFIQAASYTGLGGGGTYSAYVGAIVDLLRLTSSLHTAQYRYIPAIAFPATEADEALNATPTLNLRLNTPPSFHNPKSVIVIGLPAVQKSVLPPLRPADPAHISCLLDPHMVLPIEGAPLVFSTGFAHDLVLHLNIPNPKPGTRRNLPIAADSYQGGLTFRTPSHPRKELSLNPNDPNPITTFTQPDEPDPPAPTTPLEPGQPITGTIEGYWGFDHYVGPTLPLQQVPGQGWRILTSPETPTTLIAGQPNHLQLTATGTACVESISLIPGDNKLDWKLQPAPAAPKTPVATEAPPTPVSPTVRPIDLTLNLQHSTTPGAIRLAIQQFGQKEPDQLGTKTFAEPAKIESLHLHANDLTATLSGQSLSQVKDLTLKLDSKDFVWTPEPHAATQPNEAPSNILLLTLPPDAKAPNLKPNERISAEVHLLDGRTLETSTFVLPPRPIVTLLSRRSMLAEPSPIQLATPDDVPLGATLTFFLKSKDKFPRNETIEIMSRDSVDASAQTDPPLKTTLSIAAGSLVLEDNHTVLATFDPLKTFGPSTFGQFRLRAVTADGTNGQWLPLATIVRLPTLTGITCPPAPTAPCQLSGSSLYLIDSIALDAAFTDPTPIPEGFVDSTLAIPHPAIPARTTLNPTVTLYLRLRDDATPINLVTLPLTLIPKPKPNAAPPAAQSPASTAPDTPPPGANPPARDF
jgi:hypothetical protein